MHFSDAIEAISKAAPDDFSSLSEVLSPEQIDTCLQEAGVVATLRKRRLPLDMVVWAVVGMAMFRHIPMGQIVNHLDPGLFMRALAECGLLALVANTGLPASRWQHENPLSYAKTAQLFILFIACRNGLPSFVQPSPSAEVGLPGAGIGGGIADESAQRGQLR